MFSLSNALFIDLKYVLAALALKFEVLEFLSKLFIQRLESVFGFYSAVRASNIGLLAVVIFATRQAKHMFALTAHNWIKTEADADWTSVLLNQHLVNSMRLV